MEAEGEVCRNEACGAFDARTAMQRMNDEPESLPANELKGEHARRITTGEPEFMPQLLTDEEYQKQLQNLRRAIEERSTSFRSLNTEHAERVASLEENQRQALKAVEERFAQARTMLDRDHANTKATALDDFETQHRSIETEYRTVANDIERRYANDAAAAERHKADANWMVMSVLDDGAEESPRYQFELLSKRLTQKKDRLRDLRQDAERLAAEAEETLNDAWLRPWATPVEQESPPTQLAESEERFLSGCDLIQRGHEDLQRQRLRSLFHGVLPVLLLVHCWVVLAALLLFVVDPVWLNVRAFGDPTTWQNATIGVAGIVSLMGLLALLGLARSRGCSAASTVRHGIAEVRLCHRCWLDLAQQEIHTQSEECKRRYQSIAAGRMRSLTKINNQAAQSLEEFSQRKRRELADAEAMYPPLLGKISRRHDDTMQAIETAYSQKMDAIVTGRDRELQAARDEYARLRAQWELSVAGKRETAAQRWDSVFRSFQKFAETVQSSTERAEVAWAAMLEDDWTLPASIPNAVPVGRYICDISKETASLVQQPEFTDSHTIVELPICLRFPEQGSLLLRADGDGKGAAAAAIRATMLRLLTALPPGRVRMTIIDPVGLGEDFSAFMHLADFDEKIAGGRIWTESAQIERRLADLSGHMERIFQAYLRNEFDTIDEYNAQAGEVAEPYHFLVVSNFPVNFTEAAARRLASLAASGARCGIYTLISCDTKQPLPRGFEMSDLESNAKTLDWRGNGFRSRTAELSSLPIELDLPPRSTDFVKIVRSIGVQSKHAHRVEVPFERVAPKQEELWTANSSSGVDVALGRAGATRLQHLKLGKGTSQHVLVAGKTGSGKSSLLHTMITNAALNYSPDEIEFYLVDFKKGVEFKTYETHKLPHARVIGIESDREFGVSVLERLDGVLRERGELFRLHGVQDIESYRRDLPDAKLPRILLVIDEFQEFFVDEDALSQSASLLLDRLVRQGRAFGIHIVLGSQTLGGAYALARSTLGQIAVRIALQCSESDAHLILSEDNVAAKLLSRPGEAIYNDANGLVEGNHPFQVAWLPDDSREIYLRKIHEFAQSRRVLPGETVVFEGNTPSDLCRNHAFTRLVERTRSDRPADPTFNRADSFPTVWLGEAVSIKPTPSVSFQGRAGENLLIVGQEEESAKGVLAVAMLTLAAQSSLGGCDASQLAGCHLLDGDIDNSRRTTYFHELAALWPDRVRIDGPKTSASVVEKIAAEVTRRIEQGSQQFSPVFLFISNLARFRSLRNEEDDFGFSSGASAGPSPGKLLATVLRDGPEVGVHTIIWCDNYGNLGRWINYQMLRDFDLRLVYQMNAADSSNLIDTPAASKLGPYRALLSFRESGRLEKLRPYAAPNAADFHWIKERLQRTGIESPDTSAVDRALIQ